MLNFREWVSYHKILNENYIIEDTEVVSLPPKVLWITGMASTGDGPKFLNNMGYDCKAISTLTSRKAAYIGRFERYAWAKMFLQKKAEKLGKAHMAANVEKHNKEIDEFEPDVIVGTSQGGAVVMEIIDQHPTSHLHQNLYLLRFYLGDDVCCRHVAISWRKTNFFAKLSAYDNFILIFCTFYYYIRFY